MSEMIQVPDGWEVEKLGKFVKLVGGFAFKSEDRVSDGIRWLKIANVGINEIKWDELDYLPIEFKVQYKNFILNENDIVIAMTRPLLGDKLKISKISKFDSNSLLNQRVGKFIFSENVNKDFMYFLLQHSDFIMNLMLRIIGTDPPNVGSEDVESIILPIPKEKKEQEKIAKILSTLNKAIESTNRLIEKEKNIKKALMQELLTNGIDKDGHIRTRATHTYKESELGLIPDEWEVVSLEKLISKVIDFRGKTPLKIGMDWGNGLIPSLSANNVQMGKVDFSKETHFGSEELYNVWMNKGATQKDDILFTMEAPLGNVALIPDNNKYILSQRVILLRVGKKIISHYMYYYMMCDDFQTRMLKYSSGSTVKGIQYSQLKEMLIAFPKGIEEQKQIAKILTTQDKKIETEETNLAKLKELKKGLMNDLLRGKVRVKV